MTLSPSSQGTTVTGSSMQYSTYTTTTILTGNGFCIPYVGFVSVYLELIKLINTLQEAQLYKNETCQEKHFSLRKMCRFAIQVV